MPTFSIQLDDMRMSQLSPRKIQFFTSSEWSAPRSPARQLEGPRPLRLLDGRRRLAGRACRRGRLISFPGNFSSPPGVRVEASPLRRDGEGILQSFIDICDI